MIKCLIVEDETLAAERLQFLLYKYDPSIEIVGVFDSVEESCAYLTQGERLDFILMDIQLADGNAFDIFRRVPVAWPVIFTTAFDQYAIDAFKVLSIDYLLKPISLESLANALEKLKRLQRTTHEPTVDYERIQNMMTHRTTHKNRFVAKSGSKLHFVESKDVSYFEADNKIVYLIRFDGSRFLVPHKLEELEVLLDPTLFFRINRSIIIQISSIILVRPYLNSRLKVSLRNGSKTEEIVISRERVGSFKNWADG